MCCRIPPFLPALVLATLFPLAAQAHFLWLVRVQGPGGGSQIHAYFGEVAEPDDPSLLDRIASAEVWQVDHDGTLRQLKLAMNSDSLMAIIRDASSDAMFVAQRDLGVLERGGDTFLLRYYAKTGPTLGSDAWTKIDCSKRLGLDLVPEAIGDRVRVTVRWEGKPVSGAQVKVIGPGTTDLEAVSDDGGHAIFAASKGGLYSIRARHVENKSGESDGRAYQSIRHYSTLALRVPAPNDARIEPQRAAVSRQEFPDIPELVTSFGAAIANGALYVYGGHTGQAHAYSNEEQARTLRRLDLKNPKVWESLGTGPGLQGLAMVAHRGKLYRIGGFTAKNKEGAKHDLWSLADVACYDIGAKKWNELSPLPEPRSSFDAAVLGDAIYVVGGWQLAGDADRVWHKTAYVLDLAAETPRWQPLPEPLFQRRALSVAAHDGRIYAIGGMQPEGGPTTRVEVYDPADGKWSSGPELLGEKMDGFGSSAFATGGRLYVSTYSGKLQRLSEDGKSWELVKQLENDRFFHRLLPLSDSQLITLGGASMQSGNFAAVETIELP
jgi:hypothetical protein